MMMLTALDNDRLAVVEESTAQDKIGGKGKETHAAYSES